jgi:hypothetical protein
MGTRGHVGIKVDGIIHSSYVQYDSYPEELGVHVLDVAREVVTDRMAYINKARALRGVAESDEPTAAERKKYAKLHEQVSTGKDWYAQLRRQQGDLRQMLDNGIYAKSSSFGTEEYAYLINLDANSFEVIAYDKPAGKWSLEELPTNQELVDRVNA